MFFVLGAIQMFYVYIYQTNPHNSSKIDIIMVIILKIKKLTKLDRSQVQDSHSYYLSRTFSLMPYSKFHNNSKNNNNNK